MRSAKTLWVRFDRNDYSIPPAAVGKDLVLVAAVDHVRIFDGLQEIARHQRSYRRAEQVTDPAHVARSSKPKERPAARPPTRRFGWRSPKSNASSTRPSRAIATRPG